MGTFFPGKEGFDALLGLVIMAAVLWLRYRALKARQAKQETRRYMADAKNKPRTPAPGFQEAAPMTHRVDSTVPWTEPEMQTSFLSREDPAAVVETPVFRDAGDLARQKAPAPQTMAREHKPFELPRFTASTLVQAVIAKEILTRPADRRPGMNPGRFARK